MLTNWEKRLVDGELLTNESKTINIGKGIANFFSLTIGDTLVFIGQGYHGMQAVGAYPISGILDMKNPKLNNISVFMTLPTAQEFLSAENKITHLVIDKKKYEDEGEIAENLSSSLNDTYEVMTYRCWVTYQSTKEQLESELKHHQRLKQFRMPDLKLIR